MSYNKINPSKATLRPKQTVDVLGIANSPPEVSLKRAVGTVVLPVAVMPLSESATAIAGPTLKKSTSKNVGAFPYEAVQSPAAEPSVPTPLDAELVTGEYVSFGD